MEVKYPVFAQYKKGDVIGYYEEGHAYSVGLLLEDVAFPNDGLVEGVLIAVYDITYNRKLEGRVMWYVKPNTIVPLFINRGKRWKPLQLAGQMNAGGIQEYMTQIGVARSIEQYVGVVKRLTGRYREIPAVIHMEFYSCIRECEEIIHNYHYASLVENQNKNLEYNSEIAKSELKKKLEGESLSRTAECSYGNISTNGNIALFANDVCHYRLYNNTEERLASIYNSFSPYFRSGSVVYLESVAMLFEWVVERSPWADCFLTKDVGEIMSEGYFLDVTKDAELVYSATIVMREATEFPKRAEMFRHFVKMGIDEYISWILAHKIRMNDDGGYSLYCWDNGHSLFGDTFSIERVVDFLRNWMKDKSNPAYSKKKKADVSIKLLEDSCNGGGLPISTFFSNRCTSIDRYNIVVTDENLHNIVKCIKEIV